MGFITFLMMLFVVWVLYKVFKWIFIFLGIICVGSIAKVNSTSKKNKKTVVENTSVPVENKEPVIENKKTLVESKESIIKKKEPELKYKNAVYISFRKKVYKAYEEYKRAGDKVTWDSEKDGFRIIYGGERLLGSEAYEVNVCHDDGNLLGLANPYYILISYTFAIKKDELDRYKDLAKFINNYYNDHHLFDKELIISHVVNTSDNVTIGIYTCGIFIMDNKYLYELTKKYGEAGVFGVLLKKASDEYTKGLELYKSKYGKSII